VPQIVPQEHVVGHERAARLDHLQPERLAGMPETVLWRFDEGGIGRVAQSFERT
jgi:hypothetical protein